MFLRVFCREHGHHRLEEFSRGAPIDDELIVYTWRDATLKEISNLIKEVHESSRRRDARFSFRHLYRESTYGRLLHRDAGMVMNDATNKNDDKTLDDIRLLAGDYLDVAIYFGPSAMTAGMHQRKFAKDDRLSINKRLAHKKRF